MPNNKEFFPKKDNNEDDDLNDKTIPTMTAQDAEDINAELEKISKPKYDVNPKTSNVLTERERKEKN